MFNDFDQFLAREEQAELLAMLRFASESRRTDKLKRHLVDCPYRGQRRITLAGFADGHMRQTFVATVEGRGFNGKRRTVLLKDIRVFGIKFVLEDHLWVIYDRHWARIEPFYQAQRVVLVGTAIEYARRDSTRDYALSIEKVTKL
jgi:hypothetical protein